VESKRGSISVVVLSVFCRVLLKFNVTVPPVSCSAWLTPAL